MTAQMSVLPLDSEHHLREEILELRRGMLRGFLAASLFVAWAWYVYCLYRSWHFGVNTVVAVLLVLLGILSLWQYKNRLHVASWLFCIGLAFLQGALVYTYPTPLIMAVGSVVIVAAGALLGAWGGLAGACCVWLASLIALCASTGAEVAGSSLLGLGALYFLVWGATALSARPVTASVAWALTGWEEARQALAETQARRAELYRALRALEEATYRIEQMNRELIAARQEAEAARAQTTRFATTVSHELRGPLSLILGFSRLMALSPERYGEPLPAPYWADVDAIYRNSQHLAALVDDVLDLAQIQAERLPLVKDRVDLQSDVVDKATEIVRPLAERKGLFLRVEPPDLARPAGDSVSDEGLPQLIVDPIRLRQALLNLLTNAVRVTEQGGITVRTTVEDSSVCISVQDTGPGIAAADIPNLFREFSQVRATQKDTMQGKGSGLGLSITKQLVELHGGRVWVESAPGQGTTFYLTLPLPGAQSQRGGLLQTKLRRKKEDDLPVCLVVHRDPGIARLLARHIENYRLVAAGQMNEFVLLVQDLHPRAIICSREWQEQLESLVSHMAYEVPIISCQLPNFASGPMPNALAYLIKPISVDLLNAVMRQVEREGETTVLIADDDPDAVRLLEMMLTTMPRPYRILRAYDGQEALALMETMTPDVVFLDLLMPRMDGYELLAHMRASERLSQVPVVIVSARDPSEEQITVQMPLVFNYPHGIDLPRFGRCLQAMIEVADPRYLPSPGLA
ncbi:MAG: hybrid sensor histidine kinase/response regulator [Chloroflexi bacterium]|nr:hybrid sensor histidine kinase/response regulator [Chloroflexota bacterium]